MPIKNPHGETPGQNQAAVSALSEHGILHAGSGADRYCAELLSILFLVFFVACTAHLSITSFRPFSLILASSLAFLPVAAREMSSSTSHLLTLEAICQA